MTQTILHLPDRPKKLIASPKVVKVLDQIRFVLDERDDMAEFAWFAREYPRAYRHHVEHADFRLHSIYAFFEHAHKYFAEKLTDKGSSEDFEMAIGNNQVQAVYWDFESYLTALSAALDLLEAIAQPSVRRS